MKSFLSLWTLFSCLGWGEPIDLTAEESAQVEAVIQWIYSGQAVVGGKNPMNTPTVKINPHTGNTVPDINAALRLGEEVTPGDMNAELLLKQAQRKGSDWYDMVYCRQVLKKKFPSLSCDIPGGRQRAKPHDDVKLLTETWMRPTYALDDIKSKASTKLPLWSDDYWRIQWGATSYRYAKTEQFDDYDAAIASYSQPEDWKKALQFDPLGKLAGVIAEWSPAEKYDLTVGDTAFTLTGAQKAEGDKLRGDDGKVEAWMGICHGWAAAAIMVPKPSTSVTVKGARVGTKGRVDVTWYPHDIRAMASLAWAQGRSDSNFVGGRCNVKDPKTHKNGRLVQDECFDNAPSTFHLALGNLIGRAGLSFVMDKTFDYQVWNQPIFSYDFTYFNPLKPDVRTTDWKKDWKKVAVDYAKFKPKDRFQKPLTRGACNQAGDCDDSKIKKIVGVIASVVYLAEVWPNPGEEPSDDQFIRETYTYDLELEARNGKLLATGGEWHYNGHPDFLWVPTKTALATTVFDRNEFDVDLAKGPSPELTLVAAGENGEAGASHNSYPLCRVVSELVAKSSHQRVKSCELRE